MKDKAQEPDGPVTFEQVRKRQLLDVAKHTTPAQRAEWMETVWIELRDFLPAKRRF